MMASKENLYNYRFILIIFILALSFITGGAIGNVLDRINDGSVTDFLHLKIYNYSLFVFNLADAFITIGAILIIYFEFADYLK